MEPFTKQIRVNLQIGPAEVSLGSLANEDSLANKFVFDVRNGETIVTFSNDDNVECRVVRRDGATVLISAKPISTTASLIYVGSEYAGLDENGKPYVNLPDEAYAVTGNVLISVSVTNGTKRTTLAMIDGVVRYTTTGLYMKPEDAAITIQDLIDMMSDFEPIAIRAENAAGAARSSAESAAASAEEAAETVEEAISDIQTEGASQVSAITAKGEEVLESIPEDYSELSEEVEDLKSAFNSVYDEIVSTNVYDKNAISDGVIDRLTGIVSENANYKTSDFIPVKPNDVIKTCYDTGNSIVALNMNPVCCFDNTKTVVNSGQTGISSFTIPSGVYFVRFSISSSLYETAMAVINQESLPAIYIPYYDYYSAKSGSIENAVKQLNLLSAPVSKEDTDFWELIKSENLFNKNDITEGKYLNANGSESIAASMFYSYVTIDGAGSYALKVMGTWYGLTNALNIPCFDKNKSFVKTITATTEDTTASDLNSATLTISNQDVTDGVVYIGFSQGTAYKNTLMVVKGTYPSAYIAYNQYWTLPDLSSEDNNPLIGKIAVFDGDSICAGIGSAMGDYEKGWAGRIGVDNKMIYYNVGVSGATITAETYDGSSPRHWISRYIDTIHANYPNADYIILEGGTNDADNFYNPQTQTPITEKLGTFDETDFTGPFDDTTFYGAMDSLCKKALTYFPKAKIGFIVAQKMGLGFITWTKNRYDFFTFAEKVCKKWGIPVLNLWDNGQLRPDVISNYNPQYNTIETATEHGLLYYDGQHLTAYGYDVISPKISEWMKTL